MNLVSLLLQNKLSHRPQLGPKMSYITRIMYWIDLGADGVVPQGPTPFWQLRKNIKEKEKRSRKEKRTRNDQMMGGLGPSSLIHTSPTPYHLHHHPRPPPTHTHTQKLIIKFVFGQWPQRGQSPVKHRGTFICSSLRPSVCLSPSRPSQA